LVYRELTFLKHNRDYSREDDMKLNEFKYIMAYLFQPEDTTETGCGANMVNHFLQQNRLSWLGVMKTVLWLVLSVMVPLLMLVSVQ